MPASPETRKMLPSPDRARCNAAPRMESSCFLPTNAESGFSKCEARLTLLTVMFLYNEARTICFVNVNRKLRVTGK